MPTYEITAPDGKVLEITAPEGATQEEVLAYAQAQYKPQRSTAQQPDRIDPTKGMSTMDKLRAGFAKSFVDTGRGLRQLGTETNETFSGLLGVGLDKIGANDAARAVLEKATLPLGRSAARQQVEIDEARQRDAPLMDTGAGLAGNIAGQVGQMAVLPGGGAGTLAKFGTAAAQGAAFAGAQPVASDESRAGQMGAGAGFGVLGQGVASGLGRVGSGLSDKISPQLLALYERAQQAGIPVHFSQLSDSKFVKTLASAVGYLPFSGSGAKAAAQQEAFNRAASRGFGEDAGVIGDDVMASAKRRIGEGFQDLYSRNSVTLDDRALARFAEIEQLASRNLAPDEARVVKNQIDDLLGMSQNGQMPGLAYQAFRTDRLLSHEGGQKTFQAGAIREIRRALDEAADRSIGRDDATTLSALKAMHSNRKVVEKSLKQVEGSKGNVRPASLWPIVQQAGPMATKEMRELAKVGQMLKDPIPDSGTAARMLVYGALGTGGAADMQDGQLSDVGKLLLLGMTAGRAVNSKAAAKYLTKGSKPIQGLARLMKPAPRVLPTLGRDLTISGGRVATPEEMAQDEEIVRRFREGR